MSASSVEPSPAGGTLTGSNCPNHILLFLVHGQNENGQLRVGGTQLADSFQAIQAGHGNVDDRYVRHGIADLLNGLAAISRLCSHNHVTSFFHKAAKTGSKNRMIISQKHLDQWTAPLSMGSAKKTAAPAPGWD
jgi:hypothetical protein